MPGEIWALSSSHFLPAQFLCSRRKQEHTAFIAQNGEKFRARHQ